MNVDGHRTSELPAGDDAGEVVGDAEQPGALGGGAAVAEPEILGALGGVLGDVPGNPLGRQLAGRAAVDGLGVCLDAEPQDDVLVGS